MEKTFNRKERRYLSIPHFQLSILLVVLCSCCRVNENQKAAKLNKDANVTWQSNKSKEAPLEEQLKDNPYTYDTLLRNGYHLSFSCFSIPEDKQPLMSLFLKKGNRLIDTLHTMSFGAPYKNLGYIGTDFTDCFTFINAYGSGNPLEVRLIRKKDATELTTGFFVDADEKNELLLYCKNYDSLMVYDIRKRKDIFLQPINESNDIDFPVSTLADIVKIQGATAQTITLEIIKTNDHKIKKTFRR